MSGLVVYVDDEPDLCRVFDLSLRREEIPHVTFTDARAALQFIEQNDVSVVVCDYRMPALNGLELLNRLTKKVPFYLLSGDLVAESLAADNPGVTGVLTKPIAPSAVMQAIRRHLA